MKRKIISNVENKKKNEKTRFLSRIFIFFFIRFLFSVNSTRQIKLSSRLNLEEKNNLGLNGMNKSDFNLIKYDDLKMNKFELDQYYRNLMESLKGLGLKAKKRTELVEFLSCLLLISNIEFELKPGEELATPSNFRLIALTVLFLG